YLARHLVHADGGERELRHLVWPFLIAKYDRVGVVVLAVVLELIAFYRAARLHEKARLPAACALRIGPARKFLGDENVHLFGAEAQLRRAGTLDGIGQTRARPVRQGAGDEAPVARLTIRGVPGFAGVSATERVRARGPENERARNC